MKNSVSKKFEILEHLADLKIKVFGKNLEELFNNILGAIIEGTRPLLSKEKIKTEIKISGEDLENLLFNFLAELIYQIDVNDSVYIKVVFKKLTENELEGNLFGKKVKRLTTEIKGVTWHDFKIKKEDKGYIATILFDV